MLSGRKLQFAVLYMLYSSITTDYWTSSRPNDYMYVTGVHLRRRALTLNYTGTVSIRLTERSVDTDRSV